MFCSSTEEVTAGSSSEPEPSSSTLTPYNLINYSQIFGRQQDPPSSSVLLTSHESDDVRISVCPGSSTDTEPSALTETTPTAGD